VKEITEGRKKSMRERRAERKEEIREKTRIIVPTLIFSEREKSTKKMR
jgi:hypothetical protein